MTVETWKLDGSGSDIRFSARHVVLAKISGRFARWRGSIQVDGPEIDFASLELTVDPASIDTGLARRDLYLRSFHFFNVARYPSLRFVARRVERSGSEPMRIVGGMTIRGGTREVVLDVADCVRSTSPDGTDHASFTLKASVDRRDFGLTWSGVFDARAALLSYHVDIDVEVDAARMAASGQATDDAGRASAERRGAHAHPGRRSSP
jgi:polyisoprenoid-binding protein YceI